MVKNFALQDMQIDSFVASIDSDAADNDDQLLLAAGKCLFYCCLT